MPAVIGLIVVVLVIVGGIGFFLMNRGGSGVATPGSTAGGKAMLMPGASGSNQPDPSPTQPK